LIVVKNEGLKLGETMEERVAALERQIGGGASAEELSSADLATRAAQLAQKVSALEASLGAGYQQHRKLRAQAQPLLRAYGSEEGEAAAGACGGGGGVLPSMAARRELVLDALERMYASMAALEETVALAPALAAEHLAELPALERAALVLEDKTHGSARGAVACHAQCEQLLQAFDDVVCAASEKFVRYDAMLRVWENQHGLAST